MSLIALLFTTILIFAAQGRHVVTSITSVLRVVAPLIVYFVLMFFSVLWLCKRLGVSYGKTASQAFTGASNNFELAIAVVVAAYGADSEQALAATVGPLVEVPVLLGLAYALVWYRRRTGWELGEPPATSAIVDVEARAEERRQAQEQKVVGWSGKGGVDGARPSSDEGKAAEA